MKYMVMGLILISQMAGAEILGISTRSQLLNFLQMSLGVDASTLVDAATIAKLPVNNSPAEAGSTFFNAWSQITYKACAQSITGGQTKIETDTTKFKAWIGDFATRNWLITADSKDVDRIYQLAFGDSETIDTKKRFSLACSMVMTSPYIYMITR